MSEQREPRLPVFITGTPRSGTTLMRVILNNHPSIAIPDETNIMVWLYRKPGRARLWPPKASRAAHLATAFGINLAAEFDNLRWRHKPKTPRKKIEWFFERYAQQKGKVHWGDKTPGHARFIRELHDLFPEGTIIFMLRDPRAVVASLLRYKSSPGRGRSDFWICDTLKEAVDRYRLFMRPAIEFSDRVVFVRYEDLVSQPAAVLTDLCETQLGIEFLPQMLDLEQTTASEFYEGATKKGGLLPEWKQGALSRIDSRLADRWKQEFDAQQLEFIELQLSEYLDRFHYSKTSWIGQNLEGSV